MTIRFLASSPSLVIFENWVAAMDGLLDAIYGSALITLPSVSRKYTCNRGSLMRFTSVADARRVLQNREFSIRWLPNGPSQPAISSAPT